jgi:hypothetical protein
VSEAKAEFTFAPLPGALVFDGHVPEEGSAVAGSDFYIGGEHVGQARSIVWNASGIGARYDDTPGRKVRR